MTEIDLLGQFSHGLTGITMEMGGGVGERESQGRERVCIEADESGLEVNKSEFDDAQVLLTCVADDILLVWIKTHHGVSSIMSTLLEMEKEWLNVEWERAGVKQVCMLHLWNIALLQHYMVLPLGGTVQGLDVVWVDLGGIDGAAWIMRWWLCWRKGQRLE